MRPAGLLTSEVAILFHTQLFVFGSLGSKTRARRSVGRSDPLEVVFLCAHVSLENVITILISDSPSIKINESKLFLFLGVVAELGALNEEAECSLRDNNNNNKKSGRRIPRGLFQNCADS